MNLLYNGTYRFNCWLNGLIHSVKELYREFTNEMGNE